MAIAPKKIEAELKVAREKQEFHPFDYLRKSHVQQFLKDQKVFENFQAAYLTAHNQDAALILDEASVNKLLIQFKARIVLVLDESDVSIKDLSKEFLPSILFSRLLGAMIPWEKDSICNEDNSIIFQGTEKLNGPYQIKFPLLKHEDARKFLYFLIEKIKKGLAPNAIKDLFQPKALLPWDEFIETLPPLPAHLQSDADYDEYNADCKELGLFYLGFSKESKGIDSRILCNDFEKVMLGLLAITTHFTEQSAEKNPVKEENMAYQNYVIYAEKALEEFRILQSALIIKLSALTEILTQPIDKGGYGKEPEATLDQAKDWMKAWIEKAVIEQFGLQPALPEKKPFEFLDLTPEKRIEVLTAAQKEAEKLDNLDTVGKIFEEILHHMSEIVNELERSTYPAKRTDASAATPKNNPKFPERNSGKASPEGTTMLVQVGNALEEEEKAFARLRTNAKRHKLRHNKRL